MGQFVVFVIFAIFMAWITGRDDSKKSLHIDIDSGHSNEHLE